MAEPGRLCPSCQTPIPGDARVCPSCGAISLPGARGSLGDAVAAKLRAALGNRYRIEREIGQGGMAVVYLAHDLRHDRPVALKVLRPELGAYLGAERFLREIHFAAQLNHPHILALHDSGEADGLLFYVMPYVEGESLRQRLRHGPLPLEEAVGIAREIADGLAYAHELGVVHRDIKPENILLSHGHAAIADFGIARAVEDAGTGITATGMSPGTPVYMSPEQAAGDHTLDHRADIYSLGCVLFEMLTGHPPYEGPTPQALLVQHAMDTVPSVRDARGGIPEALDAAVHRALAKAPGDRFQTAAEFRNALGRPSAAAGAAGGPRRIAWRPWALAAALLVIGAGATVLLTRGSEPVLQPRPRLRVVVRPFEDRTPGKSGQASQTTEALTQSLQRVPALDVVASALVLEMRDAPLDTLRARFAPDRFVVGRVEAAGDSLRYTAEIVDPRTDKALADSSLSVPRRHSALDSVTAALSLFLRRAFWSQLEQQERRARVDNAEAWSLVEQARERLQYAEDAVTLRLDRQGFQSLDTADSLLALARRRDPRSDLIRIDRARIEERRGFYVEFLRQAFPTLPPGLPDPDLAYGRALADLNDVLRSPRTPADAADALELRGRIKEGLYRLRAVDSLLESAVADYRAVTDLDPHRAEAWASLASSYLTSGLDQDALLAVQHAFEEDVFRLSRLSLLRTQFDAARGARRYDLAARACGAGVVEAPADMRFEDCTIQLWSRTRSDRRSAAAALALADSLAAAGQANTLLTALRTLWVADILARAGLGDSADHLGSRATRNLPSAWQPFLLVEAAYLRVLRGEPDSALALIGTAARNDPATRIHLRTSPDFETLRADPRFARALAAPAAP